MLSFNHPCIKLPNQISLFYHTNILQIPDGKLNTHTNIHTHNIRTENHNSHTHIWNKKNTNSKKLKPNPKQTKKHETPNPPSCCLATLSCNNNNDFQKTSSNTLSRQQVRYHLKTLRRILTLRTLDKDTWSSVEDICFSASTCSWNRTHRLSL